MMDAKDVKPGEYVVRVIEEPDEDGDVPIGKTGKPHECTYVRTSQLLRPADPAPLSDLERAVVEAVAKGVETWREGATYGAPSTPWAEAVFAAYDHLRAARQPPDPLEELKAAHEAVVQARQKKTLGLLGGARSEEKRLLTDDYDAACARYEAALARVEAALKEKG